jgi:eukaryotic-like serine/threonine-protein kinase
MAGTSDKKAVVPPASGPHWNKKRHLKDKSLSFVKKLYITLLIFLALLFIADLLVMPLYTRHWQSVPVPDVTNLSYVAAKKMLEIKDFRVIKADEKYDDNNPPGFVLFQNPRAGAYVKKQRRIYLTVGKGLRLFEMPKLTGMAERDALFSLQEHNLSTGKVTYGLDSYYPKGVVVGQSREPGEEVTPGDIIDLKVSLGIEPSNFVVPDVVGEDLHEATLTIQRAGLVIGQISHRTLEGALPNTVIEQSKLPGADVKLGDTIDLVVNRAVNHETQE